MNCNLASHQYWKWHQQYNGEVLCFRIEHPNYVQLDFVGENKAIWYRQFYHSAHLFGIIEIPVFSLFAYNLFTPKTFDECLNWFGQETSEIQKRVAGLYQEKLKQENL